MTKAEKARLSAVIRATEYLFLESKFRDLYSEIEASTDPSAALQALLGELPAPKKPH